MTDELFTMQELDPKRAWMARNRIRTYHNDACNPPWFVLAVIDEVEIHERGATEAQALAAIAGKLGVAMWDAKG